MHNKWKHDWETQPRFPIKYEQDKFDELFQETGIAVLQFARGDERKMLQEEAIDRATRLPKITIHNETEVIESEPTARDGRGRSPLDHRCDRLRPDAILLTKRGVNAGHGVHRRVLPTYADFSQEDEKGASST